MFEDNKRKDRCIVLFVLLACFIHGAGKTGHITGIDTEKMIYMGRDFYPGWLQTGRQGLVFTKWITGTLCFNPCLAGLLTILLLALAVYSYIRLWEKAGGNNKMGLAGGAVTGVVWMSHPIVTEQLYFTLQSVEIALGMLLTAWAVFLLYDLKAGKRGIKLFASVAVTVLAFSMYQAFVPFYIWTVVTVLVLDTEKEFFKVGDKRTGKELLKNSLLYAGAFLFSFFVNMSVTKVFFSSSDYLEQQIAWKKAGIKQVTLNILSHIRRVQLGHEDIYFSIFYSILIVAVVLCLFIRHKKHVKENASLVAVMAFYFLSLLVTPYLMTLICGQAPVIRSQFIVPGMMAFLVYMLFRDDFVFGRDSNYRYIMYIFAGVIVLCQLQVTERLYYTEMLRYEQDMYRARKMIDKIDTLQGQYPLPVAFVGELPFEPNPSCVVGETMGHSFFEHDARVEPYSYYSSGRILGFMETLGRKYNPVHPEDFDKAWEYSLYMPEWPYEDSIQRKDDMIVVKLRYWE